MFLHKKTVKLTKYVIIELNHLTDRKLEREFLNKNNFVEKVDPNIFKENGNVLFIHHQ